MGEVVVTDSADLIASGIETLRAAGIAHRVLPDGLSDAELAVAVGAADVLLVVVRPVPRGIMERLERVGLVVRCGIGVDILDAEAATERGIWIANVPDYCVDEVADHALMLLLAASRQLHHFELSRQEGRWSQLDYPPVRRLRGRTLGIIGLGRIGSRLARRAQALGLRVIATDPYIEADRFTAVGARRVEFRELLAASDIVSIHTPLNDETRYMLDAAAFAAARPGVVLVNASRGGLVDLQALEAALASGQVAAAGLDVLDGEPDPDLAAPLLARRNVLVTPHVAWYSEDSRRELGVLAAEEAIRYLRGGQPRSLINPGARSAATQLSTPDRSSEVGA